MKYLLDTSVWSLAFRRSVPVNNKVFALLSELIDSKRVVLCGPVRQELLSGIKQHEKFKLLRLQLRAFEDITPSTEDYELAAEYFNTCRAQGIQGSNTDFLLCAISANHNFTLLSSDRDFLHFGKYIKFKFEFFEV